MARPQGREARCGRGPEGRRRDLQSIVGQGTAIIGCVTAAWPGSRVLPHPGSCLALPPCFRKRPCSRVRLARRHAHRSHTLIHTATPLISLPTARPDAHPHPPSTHARPLRALHGLRPPPPGLLSHRTLSRCAHFTYFVHHRGRFFPNRPRHGALVRTTPDLALCQLYIIHTPVLRSPRRPRACLAPAANQSLLPSHSTKLTNTVVPHCALHPQYSHSARRTSPAHALTHTRECDRMRVLLAPDLSNQLSPLPTPGSDDTPSNPSRHAVSDGRNVYE